MFFILYFFRIEYGNYLQLSKFSGDAIVSDGGYYGSLRSFGCFKRVEDIVG